MSEQQQTEKRGAIFRIQFVLDGFPGEVEVPNAGIGQLTDAIARLKAAGAEPPAMMDQPFQSHAAPPPAASSSGKPPSCPVHGGEMRKNSRGWYCPTKIEDGTWCKARPQE